MKSINGKHLDLGCGKKPRNPYGYVELYGVDLYQAEDIEPSVIIKVANLTLEKIPYPDSYFDAVSAFDFIEHIPRVLQKNDRETRFPFIELMDEIWRVLKPGGRFYAITPAYPNAEAFQDPTHVNIITDKTHLYFCDEKLYGENYGFKGVFSAEEVSWVHSKYAQTREASWRKSLSSINRSLFKGRKTHLLWDLVAKK
jgi:SAM-dependent methyltransferase